MYDTSRTFESVWAAQLKAKARERWSHLRTSYSRSMRSKSNNANSEDTLNGNESKTRHVPEVVWFHNFEDASPAKMRRALVMDDAERGNRVSHIIVLRNLRPITKLSGKEFLSAWWHIVVGHHTLWKDGVHHCNVSLSNLMVYQTSDGRWIGVLDDFDLSSIRDTPSGQERTGTVPFMALGLLTKAAIKGQVKHFKYQHDAESFIWVLTWVCICYEDGVFIGKGTDFYDWLKVDALGCHKEKTSFLYSGRDVQPSSSHEGIWKVALSCLLSIAQHYVPQQVVPAVEDHVVFQTWLRKNILEAKTLSPALLDVYL